MDVPILSTSPNDERSDTCHPCGVAPSVVPVSVSLRVPVVSC
jgi:hypothetical protein